MLLYSINGTAAYDFIFNNLWDKACYWRFITIISIVLMLIYKRKVTNYEKQLKNLENDKN